MSLKEIKVNDTHIVSVDNYPTNRSDNLVKSSGIKEDYDILSQNIESVKDIYFDVTPEGNGYWSAGGEMTPLGAYRYKSIDISKINGKYILVRAGYPGSEDDTQYTHYCYIKNSDDSYQPLTNFVIKKNITPSHCALIKLPKNAVQLDISWDYNSGVRAIVSYSYLINELLLKTEDIEIIKKRVGSFWNFSSGLQEGYYSEGGVFTPFSNYRCKAFPITDNIVGKTVIIYAGYPSNSAGYCWVKFRDNSYQKLEVLSKNIDGYNVLELSSDMSELEISFDMTSGIEPFISYYLAKEFNEKLNYYFTEVNDTQRSLKTLTLDVTSQYITEENEYIGYYDYKGGLHESDTNWRHAILNIPANTSLRFKFYGHRDLGVFIIKFSNKKEKIYRDEVKEGNLRDFQFHTDEACTLIWSYDVQFNRRHFIYTYEKSDDITELQEKVLNQTINLINPDAPDYPGKYWDNNGELQALASYEAFEVDLNSYIGKNINVRIGYGTDTSIKITGWSWIKRNDNSIVALSTYVQQFITGECAIVNIPEDSNKLLLSWDKRQYNAEGLEPPYCIYFKSSEISQIQENIEILNDQVSSLEEKSLPLANKKIFLFGDSISSTDYTWYKDYLALYTGATVYNQGASGRNAAYQASNEYFQRLNNLKSDVVVVLVGGNDSGASGTIGTFDSNSPLGQMGESIVQETDISIDYNGTKFIQAISHIIRKWRSIYWNFRLSANLNANILDTQNSNQVVYPSSGTATETQCVAYAESQGWTLGYGQRYVMKTTETDTSKREKLISVKQPKMFICTTIPQKRYNSSSPYSNPTNWERKRLACIECAEKYGLPLIDLAKEFAIDWDAEPYWPGQGYSGTSKTDNQGIYTMDGLHPNEFGYAYISQIVSKYLISDINV